jgi:VanZ family protein
MIMTMRLKNWFWRWGPAVLMMIVIYLASDTPGPDLPKFGLWDTLVKKGGHALGYALLALAYLRGLSNSRGRPTAKQVVGALALAAAYAVADELHQSFTRGRVPAAIDVLIDILGAVAGLSLRGLVLEWKARRGESSVLEKQER